MANAELICDGCGQSASAGHIARRLARLEQATRYRPVHIRALLLGGTAPAAEEEFLYSGTTEIRGEAEALLSAAGVLTQGRSKESVLADFQKAGLFATHILQCPLESSQNNAAGAEILMRERLGAVLARIRRSLRPKGVILMSEMLVPLISELTEGALAAPVLLNGEKPFQLDHPEAVRKLCAAIRTAAAALGRVLG